jgi:hypothetical protein
MDARRSPQRVSFAGSAPAAPCRSAAARQTSATSNASTDESRPDAKDEGLGTDDRDDRQDRRKPSIQLDEEQAIAVRKPDAPVHHAAQHNQLASERNIFGFKSALRLERRDQDGKDKT